MKAKSIRYERLKSTGSYEHEKIAIEVEIEDGETANTALHKAKVFVETALINRQHQKEISEAIIADQNRSVKDTNKAQQVLAMINEYDNDLPF